MGFLISCLSPRGGGGGDSLIKVGTDVRRVQNLGWAKFPKKNLMPGQKSAQKPNDWASFHDFQSAKLKTFFTLLSIITLFCQKLPKT